MDVGDAIGDDALDLLLRLGSGWFGHVCFLYFLMALRGPLRVRALVRVRWPRSGRPRRWRRPRYQARSIRRLMAMPISRRRSPSTTYLPTSARRRSTSGSDRSRILVDEFTPADSQSFFERVRPMP